jgi:hypothetical protein
VFGLLATFPTAVICRALDEDFGGEPQGCFEAGEDSPRRRVGLTSLQSRSRGWLDLISFQCATVNAVKGNQVAFGVVHHLLDLEQLPAEHRRDGVELVGDVLVVWRSEHGTDRGGGPLGRPFRNLGEDACAGSGLG